MQAITTKYSPPTSRRDARILVQCQAKTIWAPFDDSVSEARNHQVAAMALAKLLDWDGLWVKGMTKQGLVVWVNASDCRPTDEFHIAPGQPQHVKKAISDKLAEAYPKVT